MFKTVVVNSVVGTDFTIVYWVFGDRCVFMQLHPTHPCITVTYAEEIIEQICMVENISMYIGVDYRFFNLFLTDKADDRWNDDPRIFEFCELIMDPEILRGVSYDWLHLACPKEVIRVFRKYLHPFPVQAFTSFCGKKMNAKHVW
jgi:hypothetical protein